ncbi:hypothetical protein B0J13DRAFT_151055 [Dactylonectria estremocensis]|uniref:GRF-like zinc ribbon domain-containing protein n=1 Tax=Dactylonectria estremocensis TaxID=1079267 RepID=A0A9P9DUZ2_9HYPO|nr:hypothetical protein B0J13DRAFT_151055 [Dactylonectria estremocensis]
MSQRFPLPRAPICRSCHQVSNRRVTNATNRNGHAGRPYYFCDRSQRCKFITWDDARGIIAGNPQCWCGHRSRRDRANGPELREWYACASRECGFRQEMEEINTVELEDTQPPETARAYNVSPVSDFLASVSQFSSRSDLRAVSQPTRFVYHVGPDIHTLDEHMRAMSVTPTTHMGLQGSPSLTCMAPTQVQRPPNVACPLHGGRRKWFFGRVNCRC